MTAGARFDAGAEKLPALYERWIQSFLPGRIPREAQATCSSCAMLAPADEPETSAVRFNANVKCCTFVPHLPNFLVGGILMDRSDAAASGRQSLLSRLAPDGTAHILGLAPPAEFVALYGLAKGAFGQAESFRCPHYRAESGGSCGIWQHRNSVCSTWFCKHERGATGLAFWNSLRDLLQTVELTVSIWCALKLGIAPETIVHVAAQADAPVGIRLDAELARAASRRLLTNGWSECSLSTADYYIGCADLVGQLSWNDVLKIGGVNVEVRTQVLLGRYEALTRHSVPERLTFSQCQHSRHSDTHSHVQTYSRNDSLFIEHDLVEVLHRFNGAKTSDTLSELKESGVHLDDALLQRLIDFRVLRPVQVRKRADT